MTFLRTTWIGCKRCGEGFGITAKSWKKIPDHCYNCNEDLIKNRSADAYARWCQMEKYREKRKPGTVDRTAKYPAGSDGRKILSRLHGAKERSKRLCLPYNLTMDWYLAHFNVCEKTGIDLEVAGRGHPFDAEIDRIDPNKGYTMDNCRLVCAAYNRAKMNWTDADVLKMAQGLVGSL